MCASTPSSGGFSHNNYSDLLASSLEGCALYGLFRLRLGNLCSGIEKKFPSHIHAPSEFRVDLKKNKLYYKLKAPGLRVLEFDSFYAPVENLTDTDYILFALDTLQQRIW